MIFSDADLSLRLYNTQNQNFISAVAAIDNATSFAARRTAIFYANAMKADADSALQTVIDANAKLDAAIAAYNADVAASNAADANCVSTGLAVALGCAPASANAQKTVAIIKKFYE